MLCDGQNRPLRALANRRACTADRQFYRLLLRSVPRTENDYPIALPTDSRRFRLVAWLSVHSLPVRLKLHGTREANVRLARCYQTTVPGRWWDSTRLIQSRVRPDR